MDLYLEPPGFLGTGASLLADLTVVGYILLILPAMIAGFFFARRGQHRPHHQVIMNVITGVNWVLIVLLMLVAYRFDVAEHIGREPGNLRYLLPTIHGLLGLPAQLLATFIMVRMAIEDRAVASATARGERNLRPYWWKHAKPVMQIALGLWLATAVLGIGSYVVRYNVITPLAESGAAPVVTPEVTEPAVTPEVEAAEMTPSGAAAEPHSTPEVVETPEIATTPETESDS
ncbi:MAG: hypothetical protein IPK19_33105 [Chloroflexi bacterium]|nr:hypothetical protein [Chloroflexota bacterium]